MQNRSMRPAFLLLAFLVLSSVQPAFSLSPCSSCFATYIALSETNGTVNVTLFQVNQTFIPAENISYFNEQIQAYLQGENATLNSSILIADMNVTPVKDAEIYAYYYNRSGQKVVISGASGQPLCNPMNTSRQGTYAYVSGGAQTTGVFYYGECQIPKGIYKNSSVTVYFEYRGDQVRKPSSAEITIYDVSAGGLNAFADAIRNRANIDPRDPWCLTAMIILGLLIASMYFSGKSPLSYMDVSVPRITKPKPFAYGPLTAGAGNIRIGKPSAAEQKFLDALINRYSKIEGRGVPDSIRRMIASSNANSVQKYFATVAARNGGNWRTALGTDARKLINEAAEGNRLPYQLLATMNQRVEIQKFISGIGTVVGSQPDAVKNVIKYVRRVPLIGTFVTVATGSLFYGARTGSKMLKAAASPAVRAVMEKSGTYQALVAEEERTKTAPKSFWYQIASLSDAKKMKMGKLFALEQYVKRFYDDARDSMYEEVVKNVIWAEVRRELKQKLGSEFDDVMLSQMNFRKLFMDTRFVDALQNIRLPAEYAAVLADPKLTSEERARRVLAIADTRHITPAGAHECFTRVLSIDHNPALLTSMERAEKIVDFMRTTYRIHEPADISANILKGEFFITTGRNNLYYEEAGVRKNFGFMALGLKEFLDNLVYISANKKGEGLEQFTIADAFKIAWLKLKMQVFGQEDWLNDVNDTVMITAHGEKKSVAKKYVQDVLGLDESNFTQLNGRTAKYLDDLMTDRGKTTLSEDKGLEGKATKLLFGYYVEQTRQKEESAWWPGSRREWYSKGSSKGPYMLQSETVPEPEFWRGNMNFMWTHHDKRLTLLYEVRGQKYWGSTLTPGNPWELMENFMDGRLANMMCGSQVDMMGHKRDEQLKRFSRIDMQKYFNETWEYYSNVKDAFAEYYTKTSGSEPKSMTELFKFLKEHPDVTYDMLRNSKMPFVYTHDFSYIPYTKGLSISDFDRVINGVFVVEDERGKRTFDFKKMEKYLGELQAAHPDLAAAYKKIMDTQVKKLPRAEDVESLENMLRHAGAQTSPEATTLLGRIRGFLRGAGAEADVISAAEDARRMIRGAPVSEQERFRLLRAVDAIDPHFMHARQFNDQEITELKNVIKASHAPAEIKLALIYKISQSAHDWQSLSTDKELDFFKLVTERELAAEERGRVGRFLVSKLGKDSADGIYNAMRRVVSGVETTAFATASDVAMAMSNNVAVSELYRERGHEMRMRIKGQGFLNDMIYSDGTPMSNDDKDALMKDYHNYADSNQRFFMGWIDSVTRDPRGSSTQWGRQWYLSAMYHRGGAMHPELLDTEKPFLSPWLWFGAQVFNRSATINWMFASPVVRMMRAFQTSLYGYPTIWDKNIPFGSDFDLLHPWQHVQYTRAQKMRSLFNPAESVFTIGKINPSETMLRSLNVIPGLNLIPYFFPKLEQGIDNIGKPLNKYKAYGYLSKIPGFGSLSGQSFSQRSQRAGKDIVDALKQTPEDFLQYKGGGFVQHFTDSANPGVSYVDYSGRGMLAPRIARYLSSDLVATSPEDEELWRAYYARDEFVQRQATYSAARRKIAAEVKRFSFQEELTGYGPGDNPMWMPIASPFLIYWAGKWAFTKGKSGYKGVSSYIDRMQGRAPPPPSRPGWATNVREGLYTDRHTCMHCGGKVRRGHACTKCGRHSG